MKKQVKKFVDYAIDRAGDRVAERMFERYGDDVAAFVTNATNMFMQPIGPSTSSAESTESTCPPKPGLRSV